MKAFDYVIVGAGSAGCVLAARLTEDADVRVLLLEAGPEARAWEIDMPSGLGRLLATDRFNWAYVGDPEPYLDNRRLSHPRGRVLGGSSSINGMMYVRGHARDYDRWAQAGNKGWRYADLLPYFKRAEHHQDGASTYHGGEGPLRVSSPNGNAGPLGQAFIEAGRQAGYPVTVDCNGAQQEGFGPCDRTTHGGKRWSTARGYLDPVRDRPNLTIITGALALKVLFEGRRATGIAYALNDRRETAQAEREVILCGGAFNSPQLLQLSGVGDPALLQRLGVKIKQALPGVGANLSDHPDIVVQYACKQPVTLAKRARAPGKFLTGAQWFLAKSGPAASNHFEAGGFIRSRAGIEHPDLQFTFMPLAVMPGTVETRREHSFQVHIDLLRPESLGRVEVQSADPRMPPSILFNYLQSQRDRDDFRRSVALIREILAQTALDPFRGDELFPGHDVKSDAAIDGWVRRAVETCYHPVGTCKMGRDTDALSVVDDQLNVHGLEGLRVVDASIMPSIVSGNTNAPTIMIAEKAADMIRGLPALTPSEAPVWIHPQWEKSQR
ncbi:choline dehydrogenase [Dongia sp. agr-C8]